METHSFKNTVVRLDDEKRGLEGGRDGLWAKFGGGREFNSDNLS